MIQFDEKQIPIVKEVKKIIAFDLDGTLTVSKSAIDSEMAALLCSLLEKKNVAVITGGTFNQLKKQLLSHLDCGSVLFKNLVILPTSGSTFYKYDNEQWNLIYNNELTVEEKKSIMEAYEKVFKEIDYKNPAKIYGEIIEDRKTQITYSALGQKAPVEEKEQWNKKSDRRREIKSALEQYLPEFEVRIGGLTSIDITKKDIDKAYAIEQIIKQCDTTKDGIVFVGDAFYEGGNDYAVIKTGVDTIAVNGPEDTKNLIRDIIS
jgi:phosphomannomutase